MSDGYMLADVTRAVRRIRAECPAAHIERGNFGYSLSVAKPDLSAAFVVFDDHEGGPTVIGNLDEIIAALKA